MELLEREKYSTEDRSFEIYTYRNNNADELVIEVREVTNGKNLPIPCLQKVAMKGNWILPYSEYEGYTEKLAAVKQCIILFTFSEKIPPAI